MFVSHGTILVGVVLIALLCRAGSHGKGIVLAVPWEFLAGEGCIIAMCLLLLVKYDWLASLIDRFRPAWEPLVPHIRRVLGWLPSPPEQRAGRVDRLKGAALLLAFAIQFGGLAFLLHDTGGPVESPFAQMVLAYAIFTPFLANNNKTVGVVLLLSIAYYALLVWFMHAPHDDDIGKWSFFFVNGLFASLGVLLAFVDKSNAVRRQVSGEASADR